MDKTTKLKQIALIGLACLTCVAIASFARTGTDETVHSADQSHDETWPVTPGSQEFASPSTDGFSTADRIPAFDNTTRAYPVQLAAYDSIPWISKPITPHKISSSKEGIADPDSKNPDRVQIAERTGNRSPIPSVREKLRLDDPSPTWEAPETTAAQEPEPVQQETRIISLKNAPPRGRRIAGIMPHDPEPNKPITGEHESEAGEISTAPGSSAQLDSNSATSNQFQPHREKSATQINGVKSRERSSGEQIEAQATGQRHDSTRRNLPSAVVSNRYFQALAKLNRSGAEVKKATERHGNLPIAPVNEIERAVPSLAGGNGLVSHTGDIASEDRKAQTDLETHRDSLTKNQPIPIFQSDISRPGIANNINAITRLAAATTGSMVTSSGSVDRPADGKPTPNPESRTASNDRLPNALRGAEAFVLAAGPQVGENWCEQRPVTDPCVIPIDPIKDDFSPDPIPDCLSFDPYQEMQVYEGKTMNATQRPIIELGRPWYQLGQLSPGYSWFGKHNNAAPQFLVYGDVRTAISSSTQVGDNISELAYEVNLDFNLKLTSTERFHMFMSPLDNGRQNTRWLLDESRFVDVLDANIDFGYFEGDLGAMIGGITNTTLPFDLPMAMGVMPLVLQNGVWMEDAFLGFAATIPARNSPRFNISNMDVTFFAGYDKINSDAFTNDDSAARMYGIASFIDAMNGYFEIDYAFLEDRTHEDRSYHNLGLGFTRRFGRLLSHSSRIIINAGQSTDVVENTADGVLLLSENSLITGAPSTVVPYLNLFAGFDRPQSAARAVQAGGILRNSGILFEADGMTNYPTLDPTANDTYGGAMGLNLLARDFSQQLVVEMAVLGVMGDPSNRHAPGGQCGVAFRYQLPLTNALIFRTDGMYGFLDNSQDVRGLRFELRHKY